MCSIIPHHHSHQFQAFGKRYDLRYVVCLFDNVNLPK